MREMTNNIEIVRTRNNQFTLKIDGLYIHSKYNPEKEARDLAQRKYEPHHVHIVFGQGLGYFTKSLQERCKFNEKIIVIDPLFISDEIMDNSSVKKCDKVEYIRTDNWQQLKFCLAEALAYETKINVIVLPNYEKIFPMEYKELLVNIRNEQQRQIYNINTIKRFSMEWKRNLLCNLPYIHQDEPIDKLKKLYNAPVIITSGGPSLTKQLSLLKKYRKNYIVVCSGSAINSLLEAQIIPDFILTIDGSERNYIHFKDLNLSESRIVYSPFSKESIRKAFVKKGYYFIPQEHKQLHNYFEKNNLKKVDTLAGGASVAHYALSFSKYITSGPIALIGQDLAFTNSVTHAAGNKYQVARESGETIRVKGYYGEDVVSDMAFQSMIQSFEEHSELYQHDNIVFNCTEGGAFLEGYRNLPFIDFCKLTSNEEIDIDDSNSDMIVYENYLQNLEGIFQRELSICDEISAVLEKGLELLELNEREYIPKELATELALNEMKFKDMYKEELLDIVIDSTTLSVSEKYLPKINETKIEEHRRVKMYIFEYYSTCLHIIKSYKEYIKGYQI